MSVKTITQGNLTWAYIETVTPETVNWLRATYHFHPLDLEDIESEGTHIPKLDAYRSYFFLVLHFPHWNHAEKKVEIFEMDFFVGDNYVITIQHNQNKEMRGFFYRCLKNRKIKQEWLKGSSGYLLYRIIESLYHEARPLLNNIGKHINNTENDVFSGRRQKHLIYELARHRRNILKLRRIFEPQRSLMSTLTTMRTSFFEEDLRLYFDDIHDYLEKMWVIIETYKETIEGLHHTVESTINQRTNQIVSTLTIISVALLPLNLLASMYGMNLSHLPSAANPGRVWLMFAGLLALICFVIWWARRRRWI